MSLYTTVGGAYSNSFISVSDASTLITSAAVDSTNAAHWTALSTTAKELRLRAAAHYIAALPLRGVRVYKYQALAFPRDSQLDLTVIPEDIQMLQALIAYLVIDPNITATNPSTEPVAQEDALVKSVEVMGVMKVGLQYPTATEVTSVSSSKAYRILKSYGSTLSILASPWLSQFRGGSMRPRRRLLTSEDQWADFATESLGTDPYWSAPSESYYDRIACIRKPLIDSPDYGTPPTEEEDEE